MRGGQLRDLPRDGSVPRRRRHDHGLSGLRPADVEQPEMAVIR
jgi:hypothetical protein